MSSIDVIRDAVAALRANLIERGFKVMNAPGDLLKDDLWVSTSYAGGEMYVSAWKRTPGGVEQSAGRETVRVTASLLIDNPGYLSDVEEALVNDTPYSGPGSRYVT